VRRHAWFVVWGILGVVLALGSLSFGLPALVAAALIAFAVFHYFPQARGSQFGMLPGVGAVLLFVAYQNREGPGTTCWHTSNTHIGVVSGCNQHLNPLPWLVLGLVLVIAGAVAHVRSH